MIKLVTFLKGNQRLSRADFFQRWITQHAPMAAVFPGLRAYVLSREVGEEAAADAFAELWFDDRDAAQAAYGSPVGRSGSGDANAYTSRREQALLDETWIRKPEAGPEAGRKLVVAVKRPAQTPRDAFVGWWLDDVARLAADEFAGRPVRLCADTAGVVLDSDPSGLGQLIAAEGAKDGLIEIWLRPAEDFDVLAPAVERVSSAIRDSRCPIETLRLEEHRIV